jgi:hypothetical protein
MTIDASFCPSCGIRRLGGFRFCRSCGFDFDVSAPQAPGAPPFATKGPSAGPTAAPPLPAAPSPTPAAGQRNDLATFAGIAWLAAAAATAFLAFLQWDVSRTLAGVGVADEGLAGYAIANAVGALLTAFFGARCLRSPTRGFLGTSAAFAVLNVRLGCHSGSQRCEPLALLRDHRGGGPRRGLVVRSS